MSVEKIFSRQDPSRLLHILVDTTKAIEQRQDLTPEEQWLQVSLVPLMAGAKIHPHIHHERQASIPRANITQESWFVVRGAIIVRLYDLDKTALYECKLNEGGMLITFYGGHSIEALNEGSLVMETKNGPYSGRDFFRI